MTKLEELQNNLQNTFENAKFKIENDHLFMTIDNGLLYSEYQLKQGHFVLIFRQTSGRVAKFDARKLAANIDRYLSFNLVKLNFDPNFDQIVKNNFEYSKIEG